MYKNISCDPTLQLYLIVLLLKVIAIQAYLFSNCDGERTNLEIKIVPGQPVFLMPHATSKLNQLLPRDICNCRAAIDFLSSSHFCHCFWCLLRQPQTWESLEIRRIHCCHIDIDDGCW